MRHLRDRKAGFTLVEIMIVVGIIGLLAALAIPSMFRARQITHRNTCIHNMWKIEAAKIEWALHNKATTGDVVDNTLVNYLKGNTLPTCPAGGEYKINPVDSEPTCNLKDHVLPR